MTRHGVAKTIRRAMLIFGALATWGACSAGQLRQDVFLCEDALARERNCCPTTFDPAGVSCYYYEGDCTTPPSSPTYPIYTSNCVIEATCDELRARKCGVDLQCP